MRHRHSYYTLLDKRKIVAITAEAPSNFIDKKENPTTDNVAIQEKQQGGNWGSRWDYLLQDAVI